MSSFDEKKEVTGIVLFFFAVALTLMYYLPAEVTGFVGAWVKNLGFGFIGSAAALIPIFLFYAAVDFFIEKREGVSPIRIRSVILFMISVAALLAVITMDFDYFKSLCINEAGDKYSAVKAFGLLWKSGPDSSLISDITIGKKVIPGGLLGGGIACALNLTIGKVVSILALIVFILAQVVFVFKISLKKTAKTVVKKFEDTRNVVKTNVANSTRRQMPVSSVQYSQPVNNYPVPRNGTGMNSPYVKIESNHTASSNQVLPPPARGRKRMPVDSKTGFTDVSASEFGAQTKNDPNHLTYNEKTVSTETPVVDTTDFSYNSTPKNFRNTTAKQKEMYKFEEDSNKPDFYDLNNAVYASDDNSSYFNSIQSDPIVDFGNNLIPVNDVTNDYSSDDLPVELIDDNYTHREDTVITQPPHRTIRKSIIGDKPVITEAKVNEETIINDSSVDDSLRNDIPVNSDSSSESNFSATEGRVISTSEAPAPVASFVDNTPSAAPVRKNKVIGKYIPPSLNLLAKEVPQKNANNNAELQQKAMKLQDTLKSFGIDAQVVNITHGPAITRFELTIAIGTKVSKIVGLQDDIALAMAAYSVRIEAPIPGKSAIGIEIPNEKTTAVQLSGLLRTDEFKNSEPLSVPLGRDIPGKPVMCNIAKMPHLLIAGSTGSGKSVCINTILTSILYKASPDQVRLILVDPKVVELSIYNGIPHLLMPVVTDPKKASNALKWAVMEMERRYRLFAESSVRDLNGYNEYLKYNGEKELPLIVIVIDELADLMTVAQKEVEDSISRLAAMARAAGLHLLIATQRPSVDVITGVIKANVPSRIAFAVSSGTDSRTILDSVGAEKLLGKGDMLYAPLSAPKPVRGQGAFLSDKEVEAVVGYLKSKYGTLYEDDIISAVDNVGNSSSAVSGTSSGATGDSSSDDALLDNAVDIVIEAKNASVSILQRRLGIGYPRAARLIDVLEQKHVIGPFEGSKPRKVLITKTDWLEMKAKN